MTLNQIIEMAQASGGVMVAVAGAHDRAVLEAVAGARSRKFADSILVGDEERIRAILSDMGEDSGAWRIIDAAGPAECAQKAVALVRSHEAGLLMKGIINTTDMLRAVVDKENGIRADMLMSHVMLYQMPSYHKILGITDGGMNPAPSLEQKACILENAARLFCALGYESINAACIGPSEVVNPKIVSTTDAQALSQMPVFKSKYNMNVIGPVGLDLAISPQACRHKGFDAPGCGEADLLLVPSLETGNALGKGLSYFAGAQSAGLIMGAGCPIVLVSRADEAETKLLSIALGVAVAGAMADKHLQWHLQ